ncbi:MAG: 2-hydroxychromene-2-carboxylate isomerase [Alphaproteobacteria bacterium MarineAlpha9_Bin1]|nr:MAG: 2-hydroxychromene-2-carboxylate isomerase [Alphaproteobacteria bacterium MarineAlpha9_Bin1]
MNKRKITIYIDFKSPYTYLSISPIKKLAKELNIKIDWLPYVLDIPEYLGSAKVDNKGKVLESSRNDHQWRRVRYSYMDCRRYANLRKMTVLGPQKIWNTKLVSIALLWVKKQNSLLIEDFIDHIFVNFWKRELDIENFDIVETIIEKCGISQSGFKEWKKNTGKNELDAIMNEAHEKGVFGVPSYIIEDELFWGREQIPMIKARLTGNYENIL